MAQTPTPPAEEPPGTVRGWAERARAASTRVKETGGIMWDFAGFYYEENLKPVTDSCWDWASSTTNSMWDRVKKTIDNYRPSQTSPSG
ncbi:unnamed protein product [Arctogadus glacialis]